MLPFRQFEPFSSREVTAYLFRLDDLGDAAASFAIAAHGRMRRRGWGADRTGRPTERVRQADRTGQAGVQLEVMGDYS